MLSGGTLALLVKSQVFVLHRSVALVAVHIPIFAVISSHQLVNSKRVMDLYQEPVGLVQPNGLANGLEIVVQIGSHLLFVIPCKLPVEGLHCTLPLQNILSP